MHIETNIAYMPLPYRCAIEMLDNGERTAARLNGLCEHFEKAYGLPQDQHHRDEAAGIAARRYWDFQS